MYRSYYIDKTVSNSSLPRKLVIINKICTYHIMNTISNLLIRLRQMWYQIEGNIKYFKMVY